MEKHVKLSYLIDIYSGLLTEKQRQIISLYAEEDITVSEIAQMTGVSRQAVSELIKRIEKILHSYDKKLFLLDKYLYNIGLCNELEKHIEHDEEAKDILTKLKENL